MLTQLCTPRNPAGFHLVRFMTCLVFGYDARHQVAVGLANTRMLSPHWCLPTRGRPGAAEPPCGRPDRPLVDGSLKSQCANPDTTCSAAGGVLRTANLWPRPCSRTSVGMMDMMGTMGTTGMAAMARSRPPFLGAYTAMNPQHPRRRTRRLVGAAGIGTGHLDTCHPWRPPWHWPLASPRASAWRQRWRAPCVGTWQASRRCPTG